MFPQPDLRATTRAKCTPLMVGTTRSLWRSQLGRTRALPSRHGPQRLALELFKYPEATVGRRFPQLNHVGPDGFDERFINFGSVGPAEVAAAF